MSLYLSSKLTATLTAFIATLNGVESFAGCLFLSGPLGVNVPTLLNATAVLAERGALDPESELARDEGVHIRGSQRPNHTVGEC